MPSSSPALDFLRKVEIWQQTEGGTAGIVVAMPAGEEVTLHELLETFRKQGDSPRLEAQARHWLIGYRECQPPLTGFQLGQLNAVIDLTEPRPAQPSRSSGSQSQFFSAKQRVIMCSIIALIALIAAVFSAVQLVRMSHPANPVQQGSQSQAHPAPQQVPAGSTDLENLTADWGPWRNLPASQQDPQTGVPGVLLLNQGGYYASRDWTVPAGSKAWATYLGGDVGGVTITGSHALIADADGNPWAVGVGQPFVFGTDPNTILKIDPAGNVLAIPTAHAMSLRRRYHS